MTKYRHKLYLQSDYGERGSTLIVTLILLLIITVMAISEISYNSMLTRISTNSADVLTAFQTAEGALNQATNLVLSGTYSANSFIANSQGLYLFNPNNAPLWSTINWNSSSAVIQSYQGNSNAQATYIIEQLPSVTMPGQSMNKPTAIYRISVKAVGASGTTSAILQGIVQIPQ